MLYEAVKAYADNYDILVQEALKQINRYLDVEYIPGRRKFIIDNYDGGKRKVVRYEFIDTE